MFENNLDSDQEYWYVDLGVSDRLNLTNIPEEKREEAKKEWLYSFTMGIDPDELFHSPKIDHFLLEERYIPNPKDKYKPQVSLALPRELHRDSLRPILTKMDNYYNRIEIDHADRLDKLEYWIDDYFKIRTSPSNFLRNTFQIDEKEGMRIVNRIKEWIERKRDDLYLMKYGTYRPRLSSIKVEENITEEKRSLGGSALAKEIMDKYNLNDETIRTQNLRQLSIRAQEEYFPSFKVEKIRTALRRYIDKID